MRALTFQDIEKVSFDTATDPAIESSTDAIVRVQIAGVCGSDLHIYHGRERGLDRGTIMGHEFVGVVEAVGKDVRSHSAGDLVVSPFTTSCGECFFCRKGLTARCERGELFGWRQSETGLHGAQAELVRVPLADSTLVAVPDAVQPEEALLAGDVLSTGYFAAQSGGVGPGTTVAILGCGPVGLMASVAARHLGAERLIAFDRIAERLALAEVFGAESFNLDAEPPRAVVDSLTEGRGADIVLEAVGSPAATRLAIDLVRPGGTISTVGVHTEEKLEISPTEAYDKNLTFKIGRCSARYFLATTLALIAAEKPPIARIITHRLPLAEGSMAYRMFADRTDGCTKAVLIPG